VSPEFWFALGFLLGSCFFAAMALYFHHLLREEVDGLTERVLEAEKRCADSERWAAILGASLYGESKDAD